MLNMLCAGQGEVEKTDEFLLQDDDPSPQIRRRKPKKPVTESPEKPLAGKESKLLSHTVEQCRYTVIR